MIQPVSAGLRPSFTATSPPAGTTISAGGLRVPAALMLAAAAVRPLIQDHASLPCPLRTMTGIPCPLCGMTTSVEATAQLDLATAAAANPAGIVAVLMAVIVWFIRPDRRFSIPMPGVVAVLMCMWIFQLFRFSVI
ncbi:MAG TPA: DUF2752 domain-containing protein [Actinomycetota bacterium]|nr:DUF2752 domain-containing protein [Actinomycetota bacterium]